jgi:hypothetical protein
MSKKFIVVKLSQKNSLCRGAVILRSATPDLGHKYDRNHMFYVIFRIRGPGRPEFVLFS